MRGGGGGGSGRLDGRGRRGDGSGRSRRGGGRREEEEVEGDGDTYSWFRRPQEFSDVDTDGWTPLIHAVNASSYSVRAQEAAIFLLINSPFMESSGRRGQPSVAHKVVNMATTGARPPGKTALLFACSGSDALFRRHRICTADRSRGY